MPVAKNPAQEDFDSLHGKLRDGKFELAAYKFHYAAHSLDVITEVLEKQTELLAHMLDKPNTCRSTIKVRVSFGVLARLLTMPVNCDLAIASFMDLFL